MRYLLDTNICIYALKNRPPEVLQRLRVEGPDRVAISLVTVLELRYGALKSQSRERSQAKLDLFLASMHVVPFDREVAEEAARLRAFLDQEGRPIGAYDVLIAAHALSMKLVLVSNNLREFARVPDLLYENWVEGT